MIFVILHILSWIKCWGLDYLWFFSSVKSWMNSSHKWGKFKFNYSFSSYWIVILIICISRMLRLIINSLMLGFLRFEVNYILFEFRLVSSKPYKLMFLLNNCCKSHLLIIIHDFHLILDMRYFFLWICV